MLKMMQQFVDGMSISELRINVVVKMKDIKDSTWFTLCEFIL